MGADGVHALSQSRTVVAVSALAGGLGGHAEVVHAVIQCRFLSN